MKTTIGFLRRGDLFTLNGVKYRIGRLIENTNGYVACVNVETKKVKRFYIDTEVESEPEKMTIDEAILDSKKRAEAYAKHGYSRPAAKYYEQVAKWLEELKEYKELEEQGLLIKLPCKLGATVYFITGQCGNIFYECDSENFKCWECNHLLKTVKEDTFYMDIIDEIGKTVFLTKEEAEQALEKMIMEV